MSSSEGRLVVLGKVGAPHGVFGWLRIISSTSPADNILNYPVWQLKLGNEWQKFELVEVKPQATKLLVKVKGINSKEDAAKLTNALIAVGREELPRPKKGEYYWADLIGMQVVNKAGFSFGIVDSIFNTGSNDVLSVKDKKEYLIPFIRPNIIIDVNEAKKVITVEWDEDF